MPAQQHIVIIIHAAPYGSERCLSGLRVAGALAARGDVASLRVFLMSDATVAALPHQQAGAGASLQPLLQELLDAGVGVHLCRTCALARGLGGLPLLEGVAIDTLAELGEWIVGADKVLTF
ncbi:hypothetical protein C6568_13635 [Melaminivora suipulveris]|uniref:Uncharacterized protein n=1 Tax=Melaminivora suipulveris TaxID=2109913 RepID=A0A2R3QES7_9BURK|nr:DsrE family protein [Melaminivora suipulveris]AVO50177.1 hypothetical protein C6568_13635 [Melaminivora suipulveris]